MVLTSIVAPFFWDSFPASSRQLVTMKVIGPGYKDFTSAPLYCAVLGFTQLFFFIDIYNM